jgi:hypothetical protein
MSRRRAVGRGRSTSDTRLLEDVDVLSAVAIGVGASALMDLWNVFLKRAFGVPSLDYCLLGRWLLHMPRGTFRHANASRARRMSLECLVGWCAHYTIGAGLAVAFVLVVSPQWLLQPALLPAVLWGVVTVILPMFVMQPALGLGVAASRTPNPRQARLKSLATHAVFGVGLYACAHALNALSRAVG